MKKYISQKNSKEDLLLFVFPASGINLRASATQMGGMFGLMLTETSLNV